MTDDRMEELSPLAKQLLESRSKEGPGETGAGSEPFAGPPPEVEERLLARLAESLDLGPLTPGTAAEPTRPLNVAPAAATGMAASAGTGAMLKTVLVAGMVAGGAALGVAGGWWLRTPEVESLRAALEEERKRSATMLAPAQPALPAPALPAEPRAEESEPRAKPTRPTGRLRATETAPPPLVQVPPAPNDLLRREMALLERARTALYRREPAAALEALLEHERAFPEGRLTEEREAILISALVRLDREDEAAQRAGAFRAKYPRSLFLPTIDAAFQPEP